MEFQETGLEIKSNALRTFWENLDDDIYNMEFTIRQQAEKIETLNKEIALRLDRDLKESEKMIGETLKAILNVPDDLSSIGTVGITMIMKIRDMKDIKSVHKYIDQLKSKKVK